MSVVGDAFAVRTDFYQYYAYGVGGDFDESSVDSAQDGVLAPGLTGVRVSTGAHRGEVDVSATLADGLIAYPSDPGSVASACNLHLPEGIFTINHFAGRPAYTWGFGRPLTCALLVEVVGRDEANDHNYQPPPAPRERHFVTISATPFAAGRWRSKAIDRVGESLQVATAHVSRI